MALASCGRSSKNSASFWLTAVSTTAVTPLVRVPWNEPSIIMKVLDAGAYGVIVPMVSNRAEAERAVAACRYPPVGIRSNGPNRAVYYGGADSCIALATASVRELLAHLGA